MATKQEYKRASQALDRKQRKLVVEGLQIEKRKRELEDERVALLLVLRERCGTYGDNAWTPDDPLDDIVDDHLIAPLVAVAERLARELRAARAQLKLALAAPPQPSSNGTLVAPPEPAPAPAQAAPVVAAPEPGPPAVHRTMTVLAQNRHGVVGQRATCTCGWIGHLWDAEADADAEGGHHQGLVQAVS